MEKHFFLFQIFCFDLLKEFHFRKQIYRLCGTLYE